MAQLATVKRQVFGRYVGDKAHVTRRILPGDHHGHPYRGVLAEHRLNFAGLKFEAAV